MQFSLAAGSERAEDEEAVLRQATHPPLPHPTLPLGWEAAGSDCRAVPTASGTARRKPMGDAAAEPYRCPP